MKVVINRCFGGFSVSDKVYEELGMEYDNYGYFENEDFDIVDDNYFAYRTHPSLIEAIEKVGLKESSGRYASLDIVDIPDDIDWFIEEYDGSESVHETHRSW